MLLAFGIFLLPVLVLSQNNYTDSNSIDYRAPFFNKPIKYYWNVPTFQCDSYKMNFTHLTEKYGIIHNENDRFRGDQIVILYDPGSFPALLKDTNGQYVLRNGGVPQDGNLTLHLTLFEELVNELVPGDFSGVGIIDFESWRPIYRQNFGTLSPYQELSLQVEERRHPFWPLFLIEKEAIRRFEFHGRKFMEETLYFVKQLRPNATWGYYAYPYCFNMSPNNMNENCPSEVLKENDRIAWLFRASDNLYPSVYFEERLTTNEKVQMIEGRITEANRVATKTTKIYPYFWYKYHSGEVFLTKEDLFSSFLVLSTSNIEGVIFWGSSNDVNSQGKCLALYNYIDTVLGPSLMH